MEIKIGVRDIGRELAVETDLSAEQVEEALRDALRADGGLLVVQATKGRRILIPAAQVGYLDLGQEHARAVGFGFGESD